MTTWDRVSTWMAQIRDVQWTRFDALMLCLICVFGFALGWALGELIEYLFGGVA